MNVSLIGYLFSVYNPVYYTLSIDIYTHRDRYVYISFLIATIATIVAIDEGRKPLKNFRLVQFFGILQTLFFLSNSLNIFSSSILVHHRIILIFSLSTIRTITTKLLKKL